MRFKDLLTNWQELHFDVEDDQKSEGQEGDIPKENYNLGDLDVDWIDVPTDTN